MIKINLLPTKRKAPKRITELQKQIVFAVLVLGLAGGGMVWHTLQLNAKIDELKRNKAAAEARIREQDDMLKAVKNVEDERKKVTDKIAIIEQLKKNQAGPVRMLDELSRVLPAGVNIRSLSENSGNLSLAGDAFTNEDIVRFVDNLKGSQLFKDVYLDESRQAAVEGFDIYKYSLKLQYKGL